MTKSRNNVIILQAIKNYTILKWGLGRSPKRGEGGNPHSAPARTPGVYAQRLCTMQSQPSIHSLSWGKGVCGFGKDAEIERPKALCKDAYKWSNKVGAGRTDNKRPRLQRRKAHKAFL